MQLSVAEAGGPIHYADFGGSGAPIVLVHGLGGSHLNWGLVAPQLARTHRVLAPDLIGFGYTPLAGRTAGVRHNLRALELFVMQVVAQPAILVGNSMGGLIAAQMAARRPDWVESLVLVDPVCPNPRFAGVSGLAIAFFTALMAPGMGASALRRRARRLGAEAIVDQILAVVCSDAGRLPAEFRQAHIDLQRERMETMPWADEAMIQAWRSLLPVIVREGGYFRTMGQIAAPTLLLQGAEDRLVPLSSISKVADRLPGWSFRVLPGVGHVPMMEVPDQFLDALESWTEGLRPAKAG